VDKIDVKVYNRFERFPGKGRDRSFAPVRIDNFLEMKFEMKGNRHA